MMYLSTDWLIGSIRYIHEVMIMRSRMYCGLFILGNDTCYRAMKLKVWGWVRALAMTTIRLGPHAGGVGPKCLVTFGHLLQ